MKRLLTIAFSLFIILGLADVVFGNPIPWDPLESFFHLDPVQYLSIIIAEFCGVVVGTVILKRMHKARWQEAAIVMLIASAASYLLGILIWIAAFQISIQVYDFDYTSGLVILLIPEVVGTILGTVIIQRLLRTNWKTALVAMTAAMFTSLAVGAVLAALVALV